MRFSNENTQLWKEEPDCLIEYADAVPNDGCIVEIGTAEGGTARILHEITSERAIDIYTVDICPSPKAYELLGNADVEIIESPSTEFAKGWGGKKIDLLFIDGDHSFKGVYEDFYSWVPHLSETGRVLIHDVDPPKRGGVAHLAVQVFTDTLVNSNILTDAVQQFRFLHGFVAQDQAGAPDSDIFVKTLRGMVEKTREVVSSVFNKGTDGGLEVLSKRGMDITSYQACCCVEHLLGTDYAALLGAGDRMEIIRSAEMVRMLGHGFSETVSTLSDSGLEALSDYEEISSFLARLQVLTNTLRHIAEEIVGWEL